MTYLLRLHQLYWALLMHDHVLAGACCCHPAVQPADGRRPPFAGVLQQCLLLALIARLVELLLWSWKPAPWLWLLVRTSRECLCQHESAWIPPDSWAARCVLLLLLLLLLLLPTPHRHWCWLLASLTWVLPPPLLLLPLLLLLLLLLSSQTMAYHL
jgi:hypothetical protein